MARGREVEDREAAEAEGEIVRRVAEARERRQREFGRGVMAGGERLLARARIGEQLALVVRPAVADGGETSGRGGGGHVPRDADHAGDATHGSGDDYG